MIMMMTAIGCSELYIRTEPDLRKRTIFSYAIWCAFKIGKNISYKNDLINEQTISQNQTLKKIHISSGQTLFVSVKKHL